MMLRLWMACAIVLPMVGCEQGRGGESNNLRFGSPPTSGGNASGSSPSNPSASATIIADGLDVVPPQWFALADGQHLAIGIDTYIRDTQSHLSGWLPQFGGATYFPLTVVFHDVVGANYWDPGTRTAWLEWPKGPTPLPVRTRFAPLLAEVLVLDRRRELGIPLPSDPVNPTPFTQQELDAMTSGRNLAVTLATFYPKDFEPP